MHGSRSRVEFSCVVLSLLALTPIARASAQQSARSSLPPLELRIDAIDIRSARRGTLHAGAGVNLPLGYYVRLEVDGAAGITRRDSIDRGSGRVDAIARFLLDPFAEASWGISIGGGVSTLIEESRAHEYLVVVVDVEAPRAGPIIPAFQLGLGGGVRIGLVARAYRSGRR
jgi:hypothetical protein